MKTVSQALVIAGATLTLGFASPAYAGSGNWVVETTNGAAGGARYDDGGTYHKVCDQKEDGRRAVSWLTGWSGGTKTTWYIEDANGMYNPSAGNYCTTQTRNLTDGTSATLKVCLRDGAGGTPYNCTTKTFTVS